MSRPRVAMLVANGVAGDSRVQKVAWSAAEAGWEVLLLGVTTAARPVDGSVGSAAVRLMPLPVPVSGLRRRARRIRRGVRLRLERRLAPADSAVRPWRAAAARAVAPRRPFAVVDAERALLEEVVRFAPLVVHAHDYSVAGIAAEAVARVRAAGGSCHLVYDAHELLGGVRGHGAGWHAGMDREERRGLAAAAAVVTVSDQLADLLQELHGLPARPVVVENAPLSADPAAATPRLRDVVGLDPSVPLLVYSGAIAPQRGLDTVLEALPGLTGVHLALVAGRQSRHLAPLLARAAGLGVGDRVHVADYVPADQVPAYLSSADVGLIPILHYPNHEVALITKWFEYLHARLPIVVSDVEAMAAETTRLGIGEVFVAGDAAAFAAAVRRVLADGVRYRSAYDPQVLTARTWERQADKLLATYVSVSGVDPTPRPEPTPFRAFRPREAGQR